MKILDMSVGDLIITLSNGNTDSERSHAKDMIETIDQLLFTAWFTSPQPHLEITPEMVHDMYPKGPDHIKTRADIQIEILWKKVDNILREIPDIPHLSYYVKKDEIVPVEDGGGRPYIYVGYLNALVAPLADYKSYAIYPRGPHSGAFLTKRLAQQLDLPPSWGPLTK